MRTTNRLGPVAVAAGITCVALVASTGLAAAQRHGADYSQILLPTGAASGTRIGLSIEEVTDTDAEGAVVRDVHADSPAASAGFVDGDVIVEFGGERVRSASQLTRLVRETPAGRTVEATVVRDDIRVELQVTPEAGGTVMAAVPGRLNSTIEGFVNRVVPDARRNRVLGFGDFVDFTGRIPVRLGVNVQELSAQLADYFGVDAGVLVTSVDEESVAATAGLQAGDVITSVDGRAVEDSANLRRRLSVVDPGEDVSIGLTRAGRELELTATMLADGNRSRRRGLQIFGNAGRAI